MWLYICLFLIQASMQFIFLRWLGEESHKAIVITILSSFICVLIYKLTAFFSFSLLCGHIAFMVMGWICHLSLYVLFLSVLLSMMSEMIFYPLSLIHQTYLSTWEYTTYFLICFLSLIIALITNQEKIKIEKNWIKQLDFIDHRLKGFVVMISCVGLVIDGGMIFIFQSTLLLHCVILLFMLSLMPIIVCLFIYLFVKLCQTKQSESLLNVWQKESRDYMNVIRSQRHDFNFHLHAIVGLIENEEYQECQAYVSKMANEASSINDIMPVHDAVIGSMLYNMREAARKKGSDIEYDITYDMKDILCNAFECNKIIGNLIQNAIDAISTKEELKYGIHASILKRRGNTVIIVENLYQGDKSPILKAFDLGYSTKRHHEGIGLSMIARTIEKYEGRIYTEFDEDVVRFIVNIPNVICFDEEVGR